MTLDLINELRRLVGALDEQGIEYALCGGMAMGEETRDQRSSHQQPSPKQDELPGE